MGQGGVGKTTPHPISRPLVWMLHISLQHFRPRGLGPGEAVRLHFHLGPLVLTQRGLSGGFTSSLEVFKSSALLQLWVVCTTLRGICLDIS